METSPWAIITAFVCALMASVGQLLFKSGSASLEFNILSLLTNLRIMSGMVLYGLSAVLFVFALKHGRLSVLYPVIATSYIWVVIISAKYFKEPITISKFIGISLILFGVFFIVRN
jgi:uncharacterized membrane protein